MTAQERKEESKKKLCPTKEKNEHCNYERHTHIHKYTREDKLNAKKMSRENKMHVIYNRLRLILLPVDG